MGPVILAILTEVITPPQPSGSSVFQVIGMIGGLLGIVALLSLPFTIKKLRAETRSIEVTTEAGASDLALKHLKLALEEADKAITRLKDDAQHKITLLEQQVSRLSETLDQERVKSEQERELYERRVVQLLYDLHSKDLEIANLRQGRSNGGSASITSP